MELCKIQKSAGRVFVFQHPATASSREIDCLQRLFRSEGVYEGLFDMCCYGMTAEDDQGIGPVRKTTRVITNAEEVAAALRARCEGGHRHVQLLSGRAKAAAIYPPALCRAMIKGFDIWARRVAIGEAPAIFEFSRADLCDPVEHEQVERLGRYVDDIKGTELDAQLAKRARQEELEVFRERNVYEVVQRSDLPPGAKIVGVR